MAFPDRRGLETTREPGAAHPPFDACAPRGAFCCFGVLPGAVIAPLGGPAVVPRTCAEAPPDWLTTGTPWPRSGTGRFNCEL